MEKVTQCQRILDYIDQFGSISTLEAFKDLGVARLASRIHDLKKMGYVFNSDIRSAKNRYGEDTYFKVYRLADDHQTAHRAVGGLESNEGGQEYHEANKTPQSVDF